MLLSPEHLLEELKLEAPAAQAPRLEGDAASCWDALQLGAADFDTIAVRARVPLRRVIAAVSALELHGLVAVDDGGRVQPLAPPA